MFYLTPTSFLRYHFSENLNGLLKKIKALLFLNTEKKYIYNYIYKSTDFRYLVRISVDTHRPNDIFHALFSTKDHQFGSIVYIISHPIIRSLFYGRVDT